MTFAADRERRLTAEFRKEALSDFDAQRAVELARVGGEHLLRGAQLLGTAAVEGSKATWEGAKMLGGGSEEVPALGGITNERALRGAAILGAAAVLTAQVPRIARRARQNREEMMAPWKEKEDRVVNVPSDAYKWAAAGDISMDELAELEKMADQLSKAGAAPWLSDKLQESLVQGAAQAGVGAAVQGGGHLLSKGLSHAYDKLTFNRDLNRILDVHPQLKDQHTPDDIKLVYQSMRNMNPQFAKDPLIGGTLLGQILRNRDVRDPSSRPRFDIGIARELAHADRSQGGMSQGMERALSSGVERGFRTHADLTKHERDVEERKRGEEATLAREEFKVLAQQAAQRQKERKRRNVRGREFSAEPYGLHPVYTSEDAPTEHGQALHHHLRQGPAPASGGVRVGKLTEGLFGKQTRPSGRETTTRERKR